MNHRQVFITAQNEIRRVESLGLVAARQTMVKVRQRILRSWEHNEPVNFADLITDQLLDTTVETMVALHLLGDQASQRLASAQPRPAVTRRRRAGTSRPLALAGQPVGLPNGLSWAGGLAKGAGLRLAAIDRLKALVAQAGKAPVVAALRAKYGSWAWRSLRTVGQRVDAQIRAAVGDLVLEGATVKTGIRKLAQRMNSMGFSPSNPSLVETVYRTQSQLAYNAGRWQADQDPAVQEILWGYRYSTVGDARVRPEHEPLEGVLLPKEDPFWSQWWPPNGFNCRCMAIPVFDAPDRVKKPPANDPTTGQPLSPPAGFAFNPGEIFSVPVGT